MSRKRLVADRRSQVVAAAAVAAASVALLAVAPASTASPDLAQGGSAPRVGDTAPDHHWLVHSSDGQPGLLAPPVSSGLAGAASAMTLESYRVVPGLRYRHWLETDARGTVQAYLLRANLAKPGLSLQYAGLSHVSDRGVLTELLARDDAVAGVNADFFDISDTGAPLGVGVDEGRVLHGQRSGWITSFTVTGEAEAAIGATPVVPRIVGRPGIRLTDFNSPYIPPDGIGLYTPRWGTAPGQSVTDGAGFRHVRQVVVRHGQVVSNTRRVSTDTAITGKLLIGRGDGAIALARRLPVGTQLAFRVSVDRAPRVAVSGSKVLVAGGQVVATADTELHPRTAVGIDTDTGRVLLVVVDGRSESSSGYTLRQLADLMVQLGAEEALNLDGGGSSTMAAKRPSGGVEVVNSPSDGQPRRVPEGLELVYTPPAG